jgi:hypothetical protein
MGFLALRHHFQCAVAIKEVTANLYMTRKGCADAELQAAGSPPRAGKLESTAIPQAIRKRVEDAAEALGGKVTVGDVAARAGVSLNDAERTLNALAADTQGVLEVSLLLDSCSSVSCC